MLDYQNTNISEAIDVLWASLQKDLNYVPKRSEIHKLAQIMQMLCERLATTQF